MVWAASPFLTSCSAVLRLVRAVLPVASLWVGKLIIDEVVRLSDRVVVMRDRRKAGELPGGCSEQAVCDVIAGVA